MKSARKFLGLMFGAIGLIAIGIGVIVGTSGALVDETLEHSALVDASLRNSARFVEEYRIENSHLPTGAEFRAWTLLQPDTTWGSRGVMYFSDNYSEFVADDLGLVRPGEYVLAFQRGHWDAWFDYYVSWRGTTTVELNRKRMFKLGHEYTDAFACMMFGTAMLGVSRWIAKPLR